MARLGLLALPFVAALTGVAAQPPACSNVAVGLKASKTVTLGGASTATFSVQNTGSAPITGLYVGITLPTQYLAPHRTSMRPNTKPRATVTYAAPSTTWSGFTVPPYKTLRFTVKAKTKKCASGATSLQINAGAYKLTGSNLACYSGATPAAVAVKQIKKQLAPCPTPAPGPGGASVVQVATNQAFAGADPARRRLQAERELEAESLDDCIATCGESNTKPYFAVYSDSTGACSCCKNTCGALVPAPGSNVYEVLAPSPSPGPAPAPSPGPGPSPSPEPYTLCKTGQRCVPLNEEQTAGSLTACKDLCVGQSASNKFMAYASNGGFCMCGTSAGSCSTDPQFNTYAINGGVCP